MPSSRHTRESAVRTIRFDNMPTKVKTPPPPGQAELEEDHTLRALAETGRRCAMFVIGDEAVDGWQ